jgi:hypothetical protein
MEHLVDASISERNQDKVRRLVLAGTAALIIGLPAAAHAELSCRDYLRGAQLEDPDVLAQATAIAHPLLQIEWGSMAMLNEAVQTVPYDNMSTNLLLHQLVRDCEVLPNDTVDAIVVTHLKVARAQKAAEDAKKEAARRDQEDYQAPFKAKEKVVREAINVAPPLPAHIAPVQAVVGKITCGQYLKYATGASPTDSEIGRAFTMVLQRAVDADPVAKTVHIRYAGGRQYDGAYGYCSDHPDATLVNALQEFVANARSWSPAANHKAERDRIDTLRAKPDKSEEEQEEIAAYDVAARAGPQGSCKWLIAYNGYLDSRHPENTNDTSMVAERSRQTMNWCRAHPNASEDALLASGAGE